MTPSRPEPLNTEPLTAPCSRSLEALNVPLEAGEDGLNLVPFTAEALDLRLLLLHHFEHLLVTRLDLGLDGREEIFGFFQGSRLYSPWYRELTWVWEGHRVLGLGCILLDPRLDPVLTETQLGREGGGENLDECTTEPQKIENGLTFMVLCACLSLFRVDDSTSRSFFIAATCNQQNRH